LKAALGHLLVSPSQTTGNMTVLMITIDGGALSYDVSGKRRSAIDALFAQHVPYFRPDNAIAVAFINEVEALVLLCITSVASRSDVLHPKVKAVSFICVLDKEVLQSVLPVSRGERPFTDSAMEQATWKSRLRTHANEFVS
jgi:hypothetical protein